MAKTVFFIFALLALSKVAFCENYGWSEMGRDGEGEETTTTASSTISPPFTCKEPGTFCKDCSTLVNCIDGEEGLEENVVEVCDTAKGFFCYRDKGCNTTFNPDCIKDYEFKCTAQGMLPDPFDCSKYHICAHESSDPKSKIIDHPWQCKEGYGYNMVTTYCDVKLKNNTCPDAAIVPSCSKTGQSGALLNKTIYYICKTTPSNAMYPELHVCGNGKWYDGKQCVEHKYGPKDSY